MTDQRADTAHLHAAWRHARDGQVVGENHAEPRGKVERAHHVVLRRGGSRACSCGRRGRRRRRGSWWRRARGRGGGRGRGRGGRRGGLAIHPASLRSVRRAAFGTVRFRLLLDLVLLPDGVAVGAHSHGARGCRSRGGPGRRGCDRRGRCHGALRGWWSAALPAGGLSFAGASPAAERVARGHRPLVAERTHPRRGRGDRRCDSRRCDGCCDGRRASLPSRCSRCSQHTVFSFPFRRNSAADRRWPTFTGAESAAEWVAGCHGLGQAE